MAQQSYHKERLTNLISLTTNTVNRTITKERIMYTQVGSCPKCGSPVYAPSMWGSILPPPSTPSCSCNSDGRPKTKWSTNIN